MSYRARPTQRAVRARLQAMAANAMAAPPTESEEQFLQAVIELARLQGWMAYHTRDSRACEEGFPDLVLARDGQLVFAELKAENGILSDAQRKWLDVLSTAAETHVWRPSNWPAIEATLRRRVE